MLGWLMICLWTEEWSVRAAERSEVDVRLEHEKARKKVNARLQGLSSDGDVNMDAEDEGDDGERYGGDIRASMRFLVMKDGTYKVFKEWAAERQTRMKEVKK